MNIIFVLFSFFIIPCVFLNVYLSIKNLVENRYLKDFPLYGSVKECPVCSFPFWPSLRFIRGFSFLFINRKWEKVVLSCSNCGFKMDAVVKIES